MVDTVPSFENFLLALQRWKWDGSKYARYREYLNDVGNVRHLLAAIDGGLALSPYAISEVVKLGLMPTVGAAHFRANLGFDDDDLFTPTRFALIFRYERTIPYAASALADGLAAAQVDRMLAAGRMSPENDYVSDYVNALNEFATARRDFSLMVPVTAHFDVVWRVMEARLDVTAATRRADGSPAAALGYDERLVLAGAAELRDEAFRERWLRAALSEAEWLVARELALPVLRELYASVWERGYRGYQERMLVGASSWL